MDFNCETFEDLKKYLKKKFRFRFIRQFISYQIYSVIGYRSKSKHRCYFYKNELFNFLLLFKVFYFMYFLYPETQDNNFWWLFL